VRRLKGQEIIELVLYAPSGAILGFLHGWFGLVVDVRTFVIFPVWWPQPGFPVGGKLGLVDALCASVAHSQEKIRFALSHT
jgi:hypothetical protein